jgi:hypothetical protein
VLVDGSDSMLIVALAEDSGRRAGGWDDKNDALPLGILGYNTVVVGDEHC